MARSPFALYRLNKKLKKLLLQAILYQVLKYITLSEHTYLGYGVITSKKFWDSLPADLRIEIRLVMLDATRYANLYAERENQEALDKIRASGRNEVIELSIDEHEAWRKHFARVRSDFAKNVSKEVLDAIYKESNALGYR